MSTNRKQTDIPDSRSSSRPTRRVFLGRSLAAAGGLAFPHIVPASAIGRDGAVAPSERIVLGGLGLGSRGRYDLSVMLPEKDVQFVAICDVQRSGREAVEEGEADGGDSNGEVGLVGHGHRGPEDDLMGGPTAHDIFRAREGHLQGLVRLRREREGRGLLDRGDEGGPNKRIALWVCRHHRPGPGAGHARLLHIRRGGDTQQVLEAWLKLAPPPPGP